MKNNLSVLSIQSYVCFGYVGNKVAMFLLQRMGIEVTAVNTVQFSNHTGYEDFAGDIMSADHLSRVLAGIQKRGVFNGLSVVLSGYQGSPELGELIVKTVQQVKQENPETWYCCDPVIGDIEVGMFVKPQVAEYIKEVCVPLADVVTPNLFELAYLVGEPWESLDSIEALQAACQKVHKKGPQLILVTSIFNPSRSQKTLQMLVSTGKAFFLVETPRFEMSWPASGSGDATAALFVGYLLQCKDPKQALEKTAASIFEVFKATVEAGTRELQFVQSQELIFSPQHHFSAQSV